MGKRMSICKSTPRPKNDALVASKKKNGTHANLASGSSDENTPVESQEEAARKFWETMAKQAKDQLG